jgi:hypothetical protein
MEVTMLRNKTLNLIVGALIILFIVMQFLPFGFVVTAVDYSRDHTNPPVVSEPKWSSPEVRQLAVRACYQCHSNESSWPWYSNIAPASWLLYDHVTKAREFVNFSDWCRADGQSSDGFEDEMTSGGMPLSDYTALHPEAVLTAAERDTLTTELVRLDSEYHTDCP